MSAMRSAAPSCGISLSGKGRQFLPSAPGWLDHIIGGWTLSGSGRIQQGTPLVVVIRDGNQLAAGNLRAIRPNLVPGVPIKNPLWSRRLPHRNDLRTVVQSGGLHAPGQGRTRQCAAHHRRRALAVDSICSICPCRKTGSCGRGRRLQLRVDAINAFNHPIFQFGRDSDNGEIFAAPSENIISNS